MDRIMFRAVPFLLICAVSMSFGQEDTTRGISVIGKEELQSAARGDFWLMVVGINDYMHYRKLKTAVSDAQAVKNVLAERYGFDKKHTVELYDLEATAKRILQELRKLAGKIKQDDSLLIYYAGHGNIDSLTKTGAWIPVDGKLNDPTTWVDNDMLKKHLTVDAVKARHILLISDSCFAGDFFSRSISAPNITDAYVRTAFVKTSREAITSGGVEPVADAGFGGHSVFAHFLLKALKENTSPYLLPSDIHTRIKGGVSLNAEQQTQHGLLTGTGGELGGKFVLFLQGAKQNLEEMVKKKQEQIEMLKQAEEELKARREAEAAEIEAREKKLNELDKKIRDLKDKLGTDAKGESSTLDQMVAIVKKKEKQAEELARMRKKAEQERKERELEIKLLKAEQEKAKIASLKKDIAKYKKIAASEYGKTLKKKAWEAVCKKWGLNHTKILPGDFGALYRGLHLAEPVPQGFVKVEGGTFRMGSDGGYKDEKPVHKVHVNSFFMSKYEVTFDEYDTYCSEKHVKRMKDEGWGRGKRPVINILWHEAAAYCNYLSKKEGLTPCYMISPFNVHCNFDASGYRLPTEAEWEFAARGGNKSKGYTFSGGNDPDGIAWHRMNAQGKTHPAGRKKPNELGIYDMSGNVWEWCWDWHGHTYYSNSPADNPRGPDDGGSKIKRGGSYKQLGKSVAERNGGSLRMRNSETGFRIVRKAH